MNAIRIKRKIESETLTLPELKAFIGREVEIVVLDPVRPPAMEEDWNAYFAMYGLDPIDPEIYKRQREFDILHAHDHIV